MKNTKLNGRQARWCIFLTPYDFVIKHRAGKTNPADAPSRRPEYEGEEPPTRDLIPALRGRMESNPAGAPSKEVHSEPESVQPPGQDKESTLEKSDDAQPPEGRGPDTIVQIETVSATNRPGRSKRASRANRPRVRQVEEENPAYRLGRATGTITRDQVVPRKVATEVVTQEVPYNEAVTRPLLQLLRESQRDDPETQRRKGDEPSPGGPWSVDRDGLLRHKGRIFVPEEITIRRELLRLYHDDPLAGHFGVDRTKELLSRKFYWNRMDVEVKEYVKSCPMCQGVAPRRHRPYGKLDSLPRPKGPMQELTMDFITGLPPVDPKQGPDTDCILVVVDRYTKYSMFFPVSSTINAPQVAELFHNEVELRFGAPSGIVSDRGSIFTSNFWSSLCYHSKIKQRLSTAFHPQTDGQTERTNQTLEHYLRCFCGDNPASWPRLLRIAQFACNNAISATIKMSPNEALMGYNPEFRLRVEDDAMEEEAPDAKARIEKLTVLRHRLSET